MQPVGCPCCAYRQPLSRPRRVRLAQDRWEWANGPNNRSVAVGTGSTRTLVLDGGTVVDPRDGSIAADVDVRIQDGRIVAISPRGTAREDPTSDRIDAAGRFIVPGYNDMHSHALNLGDPSASLALMLAEGVTGFRQMSGSPALLKKRRDNTLPIGSAAPALLETPGTILTPLNAGSNEVAAAEIRRQQAQGADFVKMVMADPDVFMAAVDEAVAVGIPILGHLQEGVDVVAASRAGFRSVEHLGPGSPVWASCSSIGEELRSEAYQRPVIKAPPFKIPFLERIVTWRMQNLLVNPAAFSINPAQYLGREDTMGTVEPGRNADLVVLDANPLDNVENLHRINAVVRAGRHYSAADLAAHKADVAAGRG